MTDPSTRRRVMVFIDGSTLRQTLAHEKIYRAMSFDRRPVETLIDYHQLGIQLSGDREFIRTYYYVGQPAVVVRTKDGRELAGVQGGEGVEYYADQSVVLESYEADWIRRSTETFGQFQRHMDSVSFTTLNLGRHKTRRQRDDIESVYKWVGEVFAGVDPSLVSDADKRLLSLTAQHDDELNIAQHQLARKIQDLFADKQIPHQLMNRLSPSLAALTRSAIRFEEKGVDTRLAVDMLSLCMDNAYDDAILVAADEDYVPLVRAVTNTGHRVINAYLDIPGSPQYGQVLRRVCDAFQPITVDDLQSVLVK